MTTKSEPTPSVSLAYSMVLDLPEEGVPKVTGYCEIGELSNRVTFYVVYPTTVDMEMVHFGVMDADADVPTIGKQRASIPATGFTDTDTDKVIKPIDIRVTLPDDARPDMYYPALGMYYLKGDSTAAPLYLGCLSVLSDGDYTFMTEENCSEVVGVNPDVNIFTLLAAMVRGDLERGGYS